MLSPRFHSQLCRSISTRSLSTTYRTSKRKFCAKRSLKTYQQPVKSISPKLPINYYSTVAAADKQEIFDPIETLPAELKEIRLVPKWSLALVLSILLGLSYVYGESWAERIFNDDDDD